jgi:hypothetical protein
LKIGKNQYFITISFACNLLCKAQTFLQVNEFLKRSRVKAWCSGPKATHAKSTQENNFFNPFVIPLTIPTFALYPFLKDHNFF